MTAGLRASGLRKSYGETVALGGVDLTLARGEVLALMGANGAGKSTLYRLITGMERPDQGQVTIDGITVTDLPPHGRARCGLRYLPQDPSAFRGLSVQDNILLSLENQGTRRQDRHDRLAALLAQFGLTGLRHLRPAQISGGERRRCEIARIMAGRPRYILLDEPFAGLDPVGIDQFSATIRSLRAEGVGVIISDHDIHAALRIADRVQVINAGLTLACDTPDRIVTLPALRGIWLSDSFAI